MKRDNLVNFTYTENGKTKLISCYTVKVDKIRNKLFCDVCSIDNIKQESPKTNIFDLDKIKFTNYTGV